MSISPPPQKKKNQKNDRQLCMLLAAFVSKQQTTPASAQVLMSKGLANQALTFCPAPGICLCHQLLHAVLQGPESL